MLLDWKDICLSGKSRQVSYHINGYIAHQVQSLCEGWCDDELKDEGNTESCSKYLKTLSRGVLKNPSYWLSDFVANRFARLDAAFEIKRKSTIPARQTGEHILKEFCNAENLMLYDRGESIFQRIFRAISNRFFNYQMKRINELLVKDRDAECKRINDRIHDLIKKATKKQVIFVRFQAWNIWNPEIHFKMGKQYCEDWSCRDLLCSSFLKSFWSNTHFNFEQYIHSCMFIRVNLNMTVVVLYYFIYIYIFVEH